MKNLNRIAYIVLINIYMVVIAGSVVRMSGAGMGCPDWPKCFGYLIPPTNQDQITWNESKSFSKGHIIMKDSALFVAKNNFITSTEFASINWKKYTKHDYATFNKYHTWTEYFNRLFGALLGLTSLILLYFSLKKWKSDKSITILTISQILLVGFEAWLGKLTVDSNLDPSVITYHMLGVIIMIWIQLIIIKRIIVIVIVALVVINPLILNEGIGLLFHSTFYGIVFIVLIALFLSLKNKFKLSESSPLNYLGKISYGLYVYHIIVINLLIQLFKKWSFDTSTWQHSILFFILALTLSIIISIASYHWFEKPFLRLKKHFRTT